MCVVFYSWVIGLNTISRMGGRYLSGEETESLLKEGKIAVFCSSNRDGTIHGMPVWFKYSENEIVVLTPSDSRKARNVERDERVTLLIEDREVMKGVLVYGKALIDRDFELLKVLAKKKFD